MTYFFIVQGEGRGHLTQAISMFETLTKHGNTVIGMAIGGSNQDFVKEQIKGDVPIFKIKSPSLAYGSDSQGLSISKTVYQTLKETRKYLKEVNNLKKIILNLKPAAVINFYDVLGGLYKTLNPNCKIPFYAVSHQYLLLKPGFSFPKYNSWTDRFLLNTNSRITSIGCQKIALSLDNQEDTKEIVIVPPLIRELIKQQRTTKKEYFLVYLTHQCMLPQLLDWKIANPTIKVHCFVKREDRPKLEKPLANLEIHQPDTDLFIALFRECLAVASTAGFETVAEAIWMNKPILMVPVTNHFEQMCNAEDAERYGAGRKASEFNLDILNNLSKTHLSQQKRFKEWLESGEQKMLELLGANIESKIPQTSY